jgi:hypothetical protein
LISTYLTRLLEEITLIIEGPKQFNHPETQPNKQVKSGVNIDLLSARAFDKQIAGVEETMAFALKIQDFIQSQEVSVVQTHGMGEYPYRINGQARSSSYRCGIIPSRWDH